MKEYSVYLSGKNKANKDQVENLICSAQKLGYLFKYEGTYLTPLETLDTLINTAQTIEFIKNNEDYFFVYIAHKKIYIHSSFLRKDRLKEFKHDTNPDTIRLLKLFLYITKSFLLQNIRVESDLDFFSNLESSMSSYYIDPELNTDSAKKQANDENAIHAYVFTWTKEYLSDALDVLKIVEDYGYKFIDNPQSQKILTFSDALFELSEAMFGENNIALYLQVDGFIMKVIINYRLISLYPLEPFNMKTVEDETAIDIAFYLNIYLNLVQNFGFDDLIITFYKTNFQDLEKYRSKIT